MKAILSIILISYLSVSCTNNDTSGLQESPSNGLNVQIKQVASENWEINFSLTSPAYSFLLFGTTADPDFENQIEVIPRSDLPQVQFVKRSIDGQTFTLLEAVNGEPFTEFSIRLPLYDAPDRWFKLFQEFSDGVAVFTGHFRGYVVELENGIIRKLEEVASRITGLPAPGNRVVGASGESNSSITIPTSERTNGTYIYFGKSALRVYQGSEFLIDPSIPRNAATFAKEVTALALNFYSATFGNLSRNPVVFLNHGTLHEGGASGSSQDGQFLVTVYGSGYQRDNAHPWESLAHTIIHEAVHQWNAIEIKDVSETDASWIWEGGAELLTWETLKDASLIDQARYEERLSRLRQACIDEIGSSSLMEMIDAKEYAKYRCGHYFQYLAVKLLQQHEKSQNAYSLWKALFDEALDNDRTYTIETYYEVLKSNLGEKLHRKVDSLKELINTPGTDLEAAELALGLN